MTPLVLVGPAAREDSEHDVSLGGTIWPVANPDVARAESPFLGSSLELPNIDLLGGRYQALKGRQHAARVIRRQPSKVLFCPPTDRNGGKPHFEEGMLTTVDVR